MAEDGDTRIKYVADLAYVLSNSKESFYDPELATSEGGELVKSKLVKSGCGCGCREIGKSGRVMSGKKDHPHCDSTN